ncbi:MAG: helix-hairpin-helix domain-containing protein [Deltaproteobacteria bacterium]|nr:helix-hairpin-helix domain-containing protein [Deltaproteobacteria bacterium]
MSTENDRRALAALQTLPNVGPSIARDLLRLGITKPKQLAGRDPLHLYSKLCALDGKRHDPCLLDVFMAAVAFANGGPARPWWTFTPERKAKQLLDTPRAAPQKVKAWARANASRRS